MEVLEACKDQMGDAYVKRDRIVALKVLTSVSFCWPHVVPASALRMESRCLALLVTFSTWALKVRVGSNVTPSIWGFFSRGRGVLFMGILG